MECDCFESGFKKKNITDIYQHNWGSQNFKGAIVTGKRTQLTIALIGSATISTMGYKTMLQADQ